MLTFPFETKLLVNHRYDDIDSSQCKQYSPIQQRHNVYHSQVRTTILFTALLCSTYWNICTVVASSSTTSLPFVSAPSLSFARKFLSTTSSTITTTRISAFQSTSIRRIQLPFVNVKNLDKNDVLTTWSNEDISFITQKKCIQQSTSALFSSTLKSSQSSFALLRSTKGNDNNDDNNNDEMISDDTFLMNLSSTASSNSSSSNNVDTTSPSVNGEYEKYGLDKNLFNMKKTIDSDVTKTKTVTSPATTTTTSQTSPCVIKVIGVGGGGGNAVNHMIQGNITGVAQFWAVNTDTQALSSSLAPNKLNIGKLSTRGLGAGGIPHEGSKAALENINDIKQICSNTDMIFITAGMGGGTGSGAAPVIAEIAKTQCGCLTVGIVTKPFAFEGKKRIEQAERAIDELRKVVDTLIVVSNDKLLQIIPENTPVTDAFLVADDILRQGVVGISEIIVKTGLVNVDFADVRAVMSNAGTAIIGVGKGTGRNRAADAAIAAISSPLLDYPIHKSKRIVFNIVGGTDLGLQEINEASEVIYNNADDNANIIFGALVDPTMPSGEISITVLACDFDTTTNNIPKRKLVGTSTTSATTLSSSQTVTIPKTKSASSSSSSSSLSTPPRIETTTIESPPSRSISTSTTASIPDDIIAVPQKEKSMVMTATTTSSTETKPYIIPPPPTILSNNNKKQFQNKGGFKRPQRKKVGILRRLWSMIF